MVYVEGVVYFLIFDELEKSLSLRFKSHFKLWVKKLEFVQLLDWGEKIEHSYTN